ncbi:tail fiber assembly protein [Pantoea sp. DY-15]|uniref:tail fiber assembly protein n=1 Tax=Pantoea sp. DY-15 TaxID=2871489 RepID=UPI001C944316|nr:tail fiber assembly protein [Pantoea sp. DY-15]MBY4887670.1 tail fiber assembly protein [Pantoea sp. DY-15]
MASVKKIELGNDGLAAESGVITVYNYDPETGIFAGESDEFLAQGVGIPANSTTDAPPGVKSGKVSVFLNNAWVQADDHRGETVYDIESREPTEITLPGEYPAGTTPLKPATEFDIWSGKAWKTDTKAQKAAAVSSATLEKASRISEANSFTQVWQTQLMLDIITDTDRLALIAWMKYIQAVQKVDTTSIEEINWPEKPD